MNTNVTLTISQATLQGEDLSPDTVWKVLSNGEDTGLTANTSTGQYEDLNADGFINFGGMITISDFPGGTQLSFQIGDRVGLVAEAGAPQLWDIPDQANYSDTSNYWPIFFDLIELYGCTDPNAENYNPSANQDCGNEATWFDGNTF